jgi:hypothetical protein
MKNHLEKKVSELGGELARVATVHRVKDLIGLLDQILPERRVRLFAIPRATTRAVEMGLERDESFEPFTGEFVAASDWDVMTRRGARTGLLFRARLAFQFASVHERASPPRRLTQIYREQ